MIMSSKSGNEDIVNKLKFITNGLEGYRHFINTQILKVKRGKDQVIWIFIKKYEIKFFYVSRFIRFVTNK